jgi:hypothetical protein
MEQDEYAVLLRALTTLVSKLDERFTVQEEFNRHQVVVNDRVSVAIERIDMAVESIDAAVESIDEAIERIEVTLAALKDMLEQGRKA